MVEPVIKLNRSDLVEAKDLKYLLSVQAELVANNANGFLRGLLHILADQPNLTSEQLESLKSFLRSDSYQRVNLLQPDYRSRTPLTLACERSNTDFIFEVLSSEASQDLDFWGLLYHDATKVKNPLNILFTPPALDYLSKKRVSENQQMRLVMALHAHMLRRKDLARILKDLENLNKRLLEGFDPYGNMGSKLASFS